MPTRDASLPSSEAATDSAPWVVTGLVSGVVGAALVAVFFLLVDLASSRPFATPNALGSALFRGEIPTTVQPALVLGYTGIHGLVFVGFGLIAALLLLSADRPPDRRRGVVTAVALFLAFEVCFLAFAALFEPALVGELGAGWVALANALAALGMSAYIVRRDASARATSGSV